MLTRLNDAFAEGMDLGCQVNSAMARFIAFGLVRWIPARVFNLSPE